MFGLVLLCLGVWLPVLDEGAQVSPAGMTPLHRAVLDNNVELVGGLIDENAQIDAETEYGITPLQIGCVYGRAEIVEILLGRGADANSKLPGGETVLMQASRTGVIDVVESLIEHGANPNSVDNSGQTALMWAAAAGNERIVTVLLDAGAVLGTRLDSGFSALDFAAREGKIAVAKTLIDAGADVNTFMEPKNTSGRAPRFGISPLMLAVESGHFELAIRLVDWGADPNDQRSGYGPLHALSWVRKPNRGDGVDGDPSPRGSGTVGSLEFVRLLVAGGADVNLKLNGGSAGRAMLNPRGATPLLLASFTADLPLLKLLLELGGDVRIANGDGCGALQAASGVGVFVAGEYAGSEQEVLAVVQYLVDQGCDPNLVDSNGETAMHGAAYRSFPKVVDLLVAVGAKRSIWNRKNKLGSTPLGIAEGKRPGSFKPDPPTIERIRFHGGI